MSADRECLVCYSSKIYRAGRCQVHYRFLREHGRDARLTVAQLERSFEREQVRRIRQPA